MSKEQSKTERIIIVDDEPQILKSLRRELSLIFSDEIDEIHTVESGNECMELLEKVAGETSLVITDLRMPKMSGTVLLQKIHENYPAIELILLTAYTDIPAIQQAVSTSIHSLIFKPWDSAHLATEVQKARQMYIQRKQTKQYQDQLKQQLEIASEFQQKMLAQDLPHSPLIKVDIEYKPKPGIYCGGDYYDVFKTANADTYMVLIGDVSGHGIKPAFITAMLKVLTYNASYRDKTTLQSTSHMLSTLNRGLCSVLGDNSDVFMTFYAMLIDLDQMQLHISNAGQTIPYIVRTGKCLALDIEGAAIGFKEDLVYKEKTIPLKKDDFIILYTDGLTDTGPDGEQITKEDLENAFPKAAEKGTAEAVFQAVNTLRKGAEPADDMTVLTVKV